MNLRMQVIPDLVAVLYILLITVRGFSGRGSNPLLACVLGAPPFNNAIRNISLIKSVNKHWCSMLMVGKAQKGSDSNRKLVFSDNRYTAKNLSFEGVSPYFRLQTRNIYTTYLYKNLPNIKK